MISVIILSPPRSQDYPLPDQARKEAAWTAMIWR